MQKPGGDFTHICISHKEKERKKEIVVKIIAAVLCSSNGYSSGRRYEAWRILRTPSSAGVGLRSGMTVHGCGAWVESGW